jgi:hypothetical protein
MPTEEWRPIPGCEGFYAVSSLGRIRSEPRRTVGPTGKAYTVQQRILSAARNASGHLSVCLYSTPIARMLVHRAVALAFIGPAPSPLHEVAHNDGNPGNNTANNLRWATRSENHRDKVAHGTHNRGERHPLSKLSDAQAMDIRNSTLSTKQLAAAYGIGPKHAWAIKSGQRRSYQ